MDQLHTFEGSIHHLFLNPESRLGRVHLGLAGIILGGMEVPSSLKVTVIFPPAQQCVKSL